MHILCIIHAERPKTLSGLHKNCFDHFQKLIQIDKIRLDFFLSLDRLKTCTLKIKDN